MTEVERSATGAPPARGHIALYARDGEWRQAASGALDACGHSWQAAASVRELHRVLHSQRFDVVVLNLQGEDDAREIVEELADAPLPRRGILIGDAAVLSLLHGPLPQVALQFLPRTPSAHQLCQLVDASIVASGWEEDADEHGNGHGVEEIDLGEAIERAAAAVYPQAKRRNQRFATVVEGPNERALADPVKTRRAFVALLRMLIAIAPREALISVDARAGEADWTVRFQAAGRTPAGALREEAPTLRMVAREVAAQGGLFWTELTGPSSLALCLTLALPAATTSDTSRQRSPLPLAGRSVDHLTRGG